MNDKNFFGHTSSDGTRFHTRMDRYGKRSGEAKETCAQKAYTARDAITDWLSSEFHREAVLCEKMQYVGIAWYKHPKHTTTVTAKYALEFVSIFENDEEMIELYFEEE